MNPILQGMELMLVGMGTVLVFLTLLVLSTLLMSRLVRWFVPEDATAVAGPGPAGPTKDEVAAIAAAVAHHRLRDR